MAERSRLFDDLAGVMGGVVSALAGVRGETEAALRARLDELIRRLDLAGRADLEAVKELAANARAASEDAGSGLASVLARLAALEARIEALEKNRPEPPAPAAEPTPE